MFEPTFGPFLLLSVQLSMTLRISSVSRAVLFLISSAGDTDSGLGDGSSNTGTGSSNRTIGHNAP